MCVCWGGMRGVFGFVFAEVNPMQKKATIVSIDTDVCVEHDTRPQFCLILVSLIFVWQ